MKNKVSQLTAERVREVLHYDPDTGVFTWRHVPGKRRHLVGQVAGYNAPEGVIIRIDQVRHAARRLAWLYMVGHFPDCDLTHRDGQSDNNRWANLKIAPTPTRQPLSRGRESAWRRRELRGHPNRADQLLRQF
jgi:hypothetical protein